MNVSIRIDYLKYYRDTIPMWAEYFWNEWSAIYRPTGRSYEQVRNSIAERCNTESLPLAIVALYKNIVVGTGCLKVGDLDERPNLSPWVAGIFVVPEFRKQGIGSRITLQLETEALRLGHTTLYLWTPSSEALYATLGWKVLERIQHFGQSITIMSKKAEPPAGGDGAR